MKYLLSALINIVLMIVCIFPCMGKNHVSVLYATLESIIKIDPLGKQLTKEQNKELLLYPSKLVQVIRKNWDMPRLEDSHYPLVSFIVENGKASDLRLIGSSGVVLGDSRAFDAIMNSSGSLPPLPKGIERVRVSVRFNPTGIYFPGKRIEFHQF